MDVVHHVANIEIEAPRKIVSDFVSKVENLPIWTVFFTRVVEKKDNKYEMVTKIGHSFTWIDVNKKATEDYLQINSIFGNKEEKANIYIQDIDDGCRVNFHLYLPKDSPEDSVRKSLSLLEQELDTLKQYFKKG